MKIMKKITLIIFAIVLGSIQVIVAQNAPISTIGDVTATGNNITVPVTAINFTNMASFQLQIIYDPAVVTCTGGALNPSLGGVFDYNIDNSGIAIFSWYSLFIGYTLVDDSEVFNITFDKVGGGFTTVAFDPSYPLTQWADGNGFSLNHLPFEDYFNNGSITFQTDAPITTVPDLTSCANTLIDFPVTVQNFNDIGSVSLRLNFDPSVLVYQGFTNNSSFPGFFALSSTPGVLLAAGFVSPSASGITLDNDAVLFTIHFNYLGGESDLTWDEDDPASCEYAAFDPPVYTPLIDTPTANYYINGSITEDCSSQWTGDVDDDWFKTGNWTYDVPEVGKDAIIPYVSPNLQPLIQGDAYCRVLVIYSSADLTIGDLGNLTASGEFKNDGELIIKSSVNGDGSFIDNGIMSGTGSVTIGRYLQSMAWHYVSPPISDGLSGIFFDIFLTQFDEFSGTYSNIVPENIGLSPMKGYGAWAHDTLTGNIAVDYVGTLNVGNQTSAVLTNTSTALHMHRGYNLVGNPYPSAVDWDIVAGWSKTNLDAAIYVWNPAKGNYGTYVDDIKSNDVTNIIPSGQGFIVHVNSSFATGLLEVNNAARFHDNTPFYKDTDDDIITNSELLALSISTDMNSFADEAIIRFEENATPGFDPSFDAYDITGLNESPNIYTVSNDDVNLSINSYTNFEENIIISLGCYVGTDGYYAIEATSILNFPENTVVFLEDKFENVFVDLTKQNAYTFYGSQIDEPDRFSLHFIKNPDNTIEFAESCCVKIYTLNSAIRLKRLDSNMLNGNLQVFDLMGRLIVEKYIAGSNQYTLPVNANGILMVKYYDDVNRKEYLDKVHIK